MDEINSFIVYSSFFKATKAMDAESFKEFWLAINEYATKGIEPDFDDDNILSSALFEVIKPQLDANQRKKDGGVKGGRPKKTQNDDVEFCHENENIESENVKTTEKTVNTEKNAEKTENKPMVSEEKTYGFETENHRLESEKPMVIEEKTIGFESENHRLANQKPNVNDNVNDNDNVNLNDNANENANPNENLNLNVNESPPLEFSPYEKSYAEEIYKLWHENGLKESRGGIITFLQKDFRLGIPKIRAQKIHSTELLKAIENYAEVVHKAIRKGISWFESDVFFDTFCSESILQRFLPERYEVSGLETYIKRSKLNQGVSAIDNGTYKPNYDATPDF